MLSASLTDEAVLGGAACILHMEAWGTVSDTVGDVSLDFWEKKQMLWITLKLPDFKTE